MTVSHRLPSIVTSDMIYVIQRGKVTSRRLWIKCQFFSTKRYLEVKRRCREDNLHIQGCGMRQPCGASRAQGCLSQVRLRCSYQGIVLLGENQIKYHRTFGVFRIRCIELDRPTFVKPRISLLPPYQDVDVL